MLLFIDTETTGKLDYQLPLTHPAQPRLVQVAAWLGKDVGGACQFEAALDAIVQPDGWTIPPEAERIHGISNERARALGQPLHEVLDRLLRLVIDADEGMGAGRFIAHNHAFDNRMLLSELARLRPDDVTALGMLRPFCTMQALTPRMKLPGRFPGKYKWPTLDEAYRFCFGPTATIEGERHTAMTDLLACKDIFLHGRNQGWWN